MKAYDLVLGLPWFRAGTGNRWTNRRLTSLRPPDGSREDVDVRIPGVGAHRRPRQRHRRWAEQGRRACNLIQIKKATSTRCIPDPIWAVRIPSYALRVNKCTGYLPGLHERLLRPYIDDFVVCCLDDRLIYATNEKEHDEHVRKVLQRVRNFGYYCKAEKC
jgi:hypothetical protein